MSNFLNKLGIVCLTAVLAVGFTACEKDSDSKADSSSISSNISSSSLPVSDSDNSSDTESEIDYSEYNEVNEFYDDNGNVISSRVFDPYGNLTAYRKYMYNDKNEIIQMDTYTHDDKFKSCMTYEYNKEGDRSSAKIVLSDEKGRIVFTNYSEYIEREDKTNATLLDKYLNGNDEIIFTAEYSYNNGYDNDPEIVYLDKDGNTIDSDTAMALLDVIENTMYSCLY